MSHKAAGACEVLFLQSQPSQLDAPFYSELTRCLGGGVALALLNGDNALRVDPDPELGFVPDFPALPRNVETITLPRGREGTVAAGRIIAERKPRMVLVQDQPWVEKMKLVAHCRRAGVRALMRSDKNDISVTARKGMPRAVERGVVRVLFDGFAPVSWLTEEYYGWTAQDEICPFPYCSQ